MKMKHPAETLCYHQHTGFHLYAPFAVTTSSTMVEMKHPAETLCYRSLCCDNTSTEMRHPASLCYHQHTGFHLYAPFAVTTSSTMVEMKHPAETLCYL